MKYQHSISLLIFITYTTFLSAQNNTGLFNSEAESQAYFWGKERLSSYINSSPINDFDYKALMEKGIENMGYELFNEAIALFRKTITLSEEFTRSNKATDFNSLRKKGNPYPYFYIGLCKDALNEHDSAIHYHKQAILQDNLFHESYTEIGNIYLKKHEIIEAKKNLKKAIETNSLSANGFYCLAYAEFITNDYINARKNIKKAIKIDPNIEMSYILLAFIYSEENKNNLVNIALSKAIEVNHNSIPAYYYRGIVKVHKYDYENAYQDFKIAYALDTSNYFTQSMAGILAIRINKVVEGLRLYGKAIIKERNNKNYQPNYTNFTFIQEYDNLILTIPSSILSEKEMKLSLKFMKEFMLENYYESKLLADKIKRKFPNSFSSKRIYNIVYSTHSKKAFKTNLDLTYAYINNTKDAEKYYSDLISKDDKYYPAYFNRALLNIKENRFELAINDLNKCISINKYFPEAYIKKAHCLKNLNQYKNTINFYKKSSNNINYNAVIYYDLGFCYRKLGNYNLAEWYQDIAIKNDTNFAISYYEIGEINFEQENYIEGLKFFKKSILIDSTLVEANSSQSKSYFFTKDYKRCKYYAKKALEIDTNNATANYFYAMGCLFDEEIELAIKKIETIQNNKLTNKELEELIISILQTNIQNNVKKEACLQLLTRFFKKNI